MITNWSVPCTGDVFGELFQQGVTSRITTVEALERSVVFKINLMDFYFVLANHHELVQGLIRNVTEAQVTSEGSIPAE
jgi:CRP-like cAMP-binding protein